MFLRLLRFLREANLRLEEWFDDLSLKTRRIIAAVIVVGLFSAAVVASMAGKADFERDGEIVRTQETHHGVIVDHRYEGRNSTIPIVWTGTREQDLDYGWFLDSDDEGTTVSYVIDPEDPSHLIAVGEPSDWKMTPLEDTLITVVGLLVTLFLAGLAASRIVPEDADTAMGWWIDRRRGGGPRHRRTKGRH